MDFVRQARSEEARCCLRLAELADERGRPPLEVAWLYSHALELLCDLGLQDEAFRRCLRGLGRLSASARPRRKSAARGLFPAGTRPSPGRLEIKAFGTLQVYRGGRPAVGSAWQGSKALNLLELLVCHGEEPVAYELAIEALWPGAAPGPGLNNLKITLHRLRHCLEPGLRPGAHSTYVLLKGGMLRLHSEHCASDVVEFDRAMREGRQHEAVGRLEAAQNAYQHAVSLYEKPLLGEERYLDWVFEARQERHQQVLSALSALGEWAEQHHHLAAAARCYGRYLQLESCAEGIAQRLIRVYLRLGQRSEAAMAFRSLRQALASELALPPSPETSALYDVIRG